MGYDCFRGVFQALIEKHFPSAEEGSGRGARKPIPDQDLYFGEDDDFFNEPKTPSKGAWKRKRKCTIVFRLAAYCMALAFSGG